ncbi:hypothetical protein M3Y97_00127800 [Aphelenchoides bicaudatus]|nr:hypothetical protein M3Y97_00127800 [Aphelenchoides bicaudatus]
MLGLLISFGLFACFQCKLAGQPLASLPSPYLCDCIRVPGTNRCLKYDNRLQAQNLNEAIDFFEDLSLLDETKPAQRLNRDSIGGCTSRDCQICKKILTEQLESVGLLHPENGQQITHKNIHDTAFLATIQIPTSYTEITKAKKAKKDSSSSSEEASNAPQLKKRSAYKSQIDRDLNNFLDAFFGQNKDGAREVFSSESLNEIAGVRDKRAASPTDPGFIGTRYYLSCTEKGTSVDGSGLLSLCTKCWAWRELPPEYYPRYVNELVCHETDTSCLSGYATCGSGTQQLDVLRNDSGTLVPISLAASTYCECQIRAGTTLEPLIFGAPNTSPLPGIPPANPAA